jgi:hypothetical protein
MSDAFTSAAMVEAPPEPDRQRIFHQDAIDDRFPRIDWLQAYALDFSAVDWLTGKLSERSQQLAMPGAGKVGKSLLVLDLVQRAVRGLPFLGDIAHDPIRVLYFDRENGLRDIITRLQAFGAPWEDLVGRLHYMQFPRFEGQLDADVAAKELLLLVERFPAELVVIDTASRFVGGKENDSDTWLALYRLVHAPLKAAGVACWRLDHFGKDLERGARGSSAKTQDVDHVWELTVHGSQADTVGGVTTVTSQLRLTRTHTRTGIGPDVLDITRVGRKAGALWLPGQSSHTLTAPEAIRERAQWVDSYVEALLAEDPPRGMGREKLRAWAERHRIGLPRRTEELAEVVKALKEAQG